MIYMLGKREKLTFHTVEPKEGERTLLPSNKSGNRSPSLAVSFSIEDTASYIRFAKILKRIHTRLTMEGYTITENKILSDKKYD